MESLRSGRSAEAILWLMQAKKIQPNNLTILRFLGIAESSLKNYSDAIRYFQSALAIDPKIAWSTVI